MCLVVAGTLMMVAMEGREGVTVLVCMCTAHSVMEKDVYIRLLRDVILQCTCTRI